MLGGSEQCIKSNKDLDWRRLRIRTRTETEMHGTLSLKARCLSSNRCIKSVQDGHARKREDLKIYKSEEGLLLIASK